jgi:hypothetical protein
MKLNINWQITDSIPGGSGHGVDVYYPLNQERDQQFVIMFVDEFRWLHGYSNDVCVSVLSPKSKEFISRGLNGNDIINDLKKHLSWYLYRRKMPPNRIGKHFMTIING